MNALKLEKQANKHVMILCEKCLGIVLREHDIAYRHLWRQTDKGGARCPVCAVRYEEGSEFKAVGEYLASACLAVRDNTSFRANAKVLKGLADGVERRQVSPWSAMLMAIERARHFIHFLADDTSLDFHEALVNPIKNDVRVKGFAVAGAGYANDFTCREYDECLGTVVVDGLLSFVGPCDVVEDEWTWNRYEDGELCVISNPLEVARLHNRRFAPCVANDSDYGSIISMEVPF